MRFCQFTRADRQTDRPIGAENGQAEQKVERRQRARIILSQKSDGETRIVIQSIRRRLIPSPSVPPIPLVSRVMTRSLPSRLLARTRSMRHGAAL